MELLGPPHPSSRSRRPRSRGDRRRRAGLTIAVPVVVAAVVAAGCSGSSPPAQQAATTTAVTAPPRTAPGDKERFCAEFQALAVVMAGMGTPDKFDAAVIQLKQGFAALNDLTPPDVAADWSTVNEGLQQVTTFEGLAEFTRGPNRPASERIRAWARANCGFDPNNPPRPRPTTPTIPPSSAPPPAG